MTAASTVLHLTVNGDPAEAPAGATVADLLRARGVDLAQPGIAVAVDGAVVRRSQWAAHALEDRGEVEIITAAQGG